MDVLRSGSSARFPAIRERNNEIVMQIVKAAVLYFALVFGAGFMLGTIRTLWVVPRPMLSNTPAKRASSTAISSPQT